MEALGINLPGLITQIVSFVILFAILYKLLYNPILNMLDQRSNKIKEGLETAERVRAEAEEERLKLRDELESDRADRERVMATARERAEQFREEEFEKVRAEIDAERTRAEASITREKEAAIEALRGEFADLSIVAAEQIIERSLNASDHEAIIDNVLKNAGSGAASN